MKIKDNVKLAIWAPLVCIVALNMTQEKIDAYNNGTIDKFEQNQRLKDIKFMLGILALMAPVILIKYLVYIWS